MIVEDEQNHLKESGTKEMMKIRKVDIISSTQSSTAKVSANFIDPVLTRLMGQRIPPKLTNTKKHEGILPSQRKDHRLQGEETEQAMKERVAHSVGHKVLVSLMISMERGICSELKDMANVFATTMKELITEMKKWMPSKDEIKPYES